MSTSLEVSKHPYSSISVNSSLKYWVTETRTSFQNLSIRWFRPEDPRRKLRRSLPYFSFMRDSAPLFSKPPSARRHDGKQYLLTACWNSFNTVSDVLLVFADRYKQSLE